MQIDNVSPFQTTILLLGIIQSSIQLPYQENDLINQIVEKMQCVGREEIDHNSRKYDLKTSCEQLLRWLGRNQSQLTSRQPQLDDSLHSILINLGQKFHCQERDAT